MRFAFPSRAGAVGARSPALRSHVARLRARFAPLIYALRRRDLNADFSGSSRKAHANFFFVLVTKKYCTRAEKSIIKVFVREQCALLSHPGLVDERARLGDYALLNEKLIPGPARLLSPEPPRFTQELHSLYSVLP